MAHEGGEPLDPLSAIVMIVILSILGYTAYDSIYRYLQEKAPAVVQQLPDPQAPVLEVQQ